MAEVTQRPCAKSYLNMEIEIYNVARQCGNCRGLNDYQLGFQMGEIIYESSLEQGEEWLPLISLINKVYSVEFALGCCWLD